MGTLIAKKYPTKLFLKAADHTYVECGTGAKAGSCWGGKTGGTAFNNRTGGTARANAIAQPNERANITCYLVNGVCHQAANRILLPAGILVSGARGYSLSQAIFGAYGKVMGGRCHAPFNQYPGVAGDLPACTPAAGGATHTRATAKQTQRQRSRNSLLRMLEKRAAGAQDALEGMRINVRAFEREVQFALDGTLSDKTAQGLREAKVKADLEHLRLCQNFERQEVNAVQFVKGFNRMTVNFQDDLANALSKVQYRRVFDLTPEERIYLADPDILDEQFGKGTQRPCTAKNCKASDLHHDSEGCFRSRSTPDSARVRTGDR